MATEIVKMLLRAGPEADRQRVILADREPAWITDTKRFYIGDGSTTGGISIPNLRSLYPAVSSTYKDLVFEPLVAGSQISILALDHASLSTNVARDWADDRYILQDPTKSLGSNYFIITATQTISSQLIVKDTLTVMQSSYFAKEVVFDSTVSARDIVVSDGSGNTIFNVTPDQTTINNTIALSGDLNMCKIPNSTGKIICKILSGCNNLITVYNDLYAKGNINADGEITAYASDKRLKENIESVKDPLNKILQLSGVKFDWNQLSRDLGFKPTVEKNDTGFVAQNVEDTIPNAVRPAPFNNDYKTVVIEKIVPYLVESIKILNKRVQDLEQKLGE